MLSALCCLLWRLALLCFLVWRGLQKPGSEPRLRTCESIEMELLMDFPSEYVSVKSKQLLGVLALSHPLIRCLIVGFSKQQSLHFCQLANHKNKAGILVIKGVIKLGPSRVHRILFFDLVPSHNISRECIFPSSISYQWEVERTFPERECALRFYS